MANVTECRKAVREIDRQIDAVRDELLSIEVVDELSPASWQRAWDRHPTLRAWENLLFRRRADARAELTAAEHKALPSFHPRRVRKCPACRGSGFAKAAA